MTMVISEFLKSLLLTMIYGATGYLTLFYKGPSARSPVNFRVAFLSLFTGLVLFVSFLFHWAIFRISHLIVHMLSLSLGKSQVKP